MSDLGIIARKYGLEIVSNPELYKDFDKSLFYKGSDTFDVVFDNVYDSEKGVLK